MWSKWGPERTIWLGDSSIWWMEFYDRAVKLVITAEVPIEDIYAGGRLDFEFERTCSRLQEMQSSEYLGREHRA